MKLAHPDGELATSRAAAKFGLAMGLSSYSNYPLEEVAAQGTGNPYVMQMCVLRDRSITLQLLERAESMSYLNGFFVWLHWLGGANILFQRLGTRRCSYLLMYPC
jgi:isopentenyl diphosphate isomerase/L-lactate dehydrogenase-like FMN-dependent dehydrogenase